MYTGLIIEATTSRNAVVAWSPFARPQETTTRLPFRRCSLTLKGRWLLFPPLAGGIPCQPFLKFILNWLPYLAQVVSLILPSTSTTFTIALLLLSRISTLTLLGLLPSSHLLELIFSSCFYFLRLSRVTLSITLPYALYLHFPHRVRV